MSRKTAAPPPRYLQAQALADALGVSRSTIWIWARSGRIAPPTYIGPTPLWDLNAVLAGATAVPVTKRQRPTRKAGRP